MRSTNANSPHRAEIGKVLVHSRRDGGASAGAHGGRRGTRAGPRVAGCSSSTPSRVATADAFYRALGWHEIGVVPDYALLPDGPPSADDVLLEGPAVTRESSTVLIAPDSFKGSLTSVAGRAGAGRRLARAPGPTTTILLCPLADGGEGTLERDRGGRRLAVAEQPTVRDPLGRPISARWLRSDDGTPRGRSRWPRRPACRGSRRPSATPIAATSVGTGDLIRAALDAGVPIDRPRDRRQRHDRRRRRPAARRSARGPTATAPIADLAGLDPRLGTVDLAVACDVSNPLLGPIGRRRGLRPAEGRDARRTSPSSIARLARCADALEAAAGRRERDDARGRRGRRRRVRAARDPGPLPRRSPCGPASTSSWRRPTSTPGSPGADLVITGEGRIDAQTGVRQDGARRRAGGPQAAGVPCVAVGGGVEPEGIEALAAVGAIAVPVVERPQTVEEAMAAGTAPLERCGERLARLVALG